MKIGVFGKEILNEESVDFVHFIIDMLRNRGVEVFVHERFVEVIKKGKLNKSKAEVFTEGDPVIPSLDCMLSLGGDGTLLETVTVIRDTGIPIVGINLGRLGFLASVSKNDIYYAIDELIKGSFAIDKRSLLYLECDTPLFGELNFGLNDFVIHKNDTSSMITIHTFINGEFLNSYWGDGLIISTPTGSTGYSLSCGGPILFPQSGSFAVTPVSPHNLNVRPIIISDDSVLSFEIEGRSNSFLVSMDSRSTSVNYDVQMAIRKAPFTVNLVKLNNSNYLKTLRSKLNWGVDVRN
ncbi:MAG: NAD kinase [Bacteroidota bacterium]|nr:NAD kinase [Bacteroidota bacterium]MDX5429864.1 NAD kinase [Bacteroidota bacterium]MDX5468643.1 NAD kinase [Bacteroidota bacterium]